jgi:hypothetical protein
LTHRLRTFFQAQNKNDSRTGIAMAALVKPQNQSADERTKANRKQLAGRTTKKLTSTNETEKASIPISTTII